MKLSKVQTSMHILEMTLHTYTFHFVVILYEETPLLARKNSVPL